MTKEEALKQFILMREGRPWGDYWSMQEMWSYYVDSLNKDGIITDRQAMSWNNPTTPEKFDKWTRKYFGEFSI